MKATLNKMVEKTHGLILRFGHTSKNMAVQVDEYIGSQIDERYENLKIDRQEHWYGFYLVWSFFWQLQSLWLCRLLDFFRQLRIV